MDAICKSTVSRFTVNINKETFVNEIMSAGNNY